MGNKPFTMIAAALFAIAMLLHIYRLFTHYQITAGSHAIPQSASYVAIIVAAIMTWGLYQESKR
jgi:hypothetical protein